MLGSVGSWICEWIFIALDKWLVWYSWFAYRSMKMMFIMFILEEDEGQKKSEIAIYSNKQLWKYQNNSKQDGKKG